MDLALSFANQMVTGSGHDDVGAFVISGRYDAQTKECDWTKTYVGAHTVYYRGFREGKGIWGTWELPDSKGGFHIWPRRQGEDNEESISESEDQPLEDARGTVVGARTKHELRITNYQLNNPALFHFLRVAPEPFEAVILTNVIAHDMHDDIDVIHDHPVARRAAVDVGGVNPLVFQFGLDFVDDGFEVRLARRRADDEIVRHRR